LPRPQRQPDWRGSRPLKPTNMPEDVNQLRAETVTDGVNRDEIEVAPESSTLGRQALTELETRLIAGQLLPSTKISLRSLAQSIGMSMQPVREAVARLVASSALEITSGRALRVPALNKEIAQDIWSMRLLLEGEAAARFAARCRPEETTPLFEMNRVLRGYRFGVDLEPTMKTTMAWNIGLARGSASPILIAMIDNLRLRYAPSVAQALSTEAPHDDEFLQFTLHIQDELLLAIEAGDAAAAGNLRCADIRSFQRYLFARLGW
jgi:GntR family colanic acid and biofilm gene transcriptional regulator